MGYLSVEVFPSPKPHPVGANRKFFVVVVVFVFFFFFRFVLIIGVVSPRCIKIVMCLKLIRLLLIQIGHSAEIILKIN